ncbi:MAG: GbsR/MarR family transcriptional regulator [Bacteroidota bacterium]
MTNEHSQTHEEALEQFVLLWGEMASAWGINRTMAQIHALLYAEADPLDTDAIMDQLEISRGNANMNLRNLLQWQLIHKVHFKGNRKDFYTAEKDVWNIVSTIIRERQQREVAPIRQNLNKTLDLFEDQESLSEEEKDFKKRIEKFTEFLEMFERFTEALLPYINKKNLKFLKHLVKLAEMKHSITGKKPDSNPPSHHE